MPLFKKKRPPVISARLDQEQDRGGYWGTSPDRPEVNDMAIVVPWEDYPNTLERAWWGSVVEVHNGSSRNWMLRMYRVTLLKPFTDPVADPITPA